MTIENTPTELKRTPLYVSNYFVPELEKFLAAKYQWSNDDKAGDLENIEWWRLSFGIPESIPSWDSACQFTDGEVMRVEFEVIGFLGRYENQRTRIIGAVEYYYQSSSETGPAKVMCNIVDADVMG